MKHQKTTTHDNAQTTALKLIEVGKIDTVYSDLYVHRARNLISEVLPNKAYRELTEQRALIPYLTKKIRSAMNKEDWGEVKQLSERMGTINNLLERNRPLFELGRLVYDSYDIVPDPFSPGLQNLTGVPPEELPAFRDRVAKKLMELEKEDPYWKTFYLLRHTAFQNISFDGRVGDKYETGRIMEEALHRQAIQALKSGDMELLEHVADSLMEQIPEGAPAAKTDESGLPSDSGKKDRIFSFSKETVAKAEGLGLVVLRVKAEREYALLFHRYVWHPVFVEDIERQWGATHKTEVPFSAEIADPMKKRIEHYAMHPFINSGGARHLPDMVAEDFLVEDFPDPADGEETPTSELLTALGLKKRRGLSRMQIEQVLLEHGSRIIKDGLGLEPEDFRLVCIPSDLYMRAGQSRGWGNRKIWTHFDGYKILKDRKLMAMAGGDMRFGGVYDLVTIGREYESDGVIVRFAVVQRERMKAW